MAPGTVQIISHTPHSGPRNGIQVDVLIVILENFRFSSFIGFNAWGLQAVMQGKSSHK